MYVLVKPGMSSKSRCSNATSQTQQQSSTSRQQQQTVQEPVLNDGGLFSPMSIDNSVSAVVGEYLENRNIDSSYITNPSVVTKSAVEYLNMLIVQHNFKTLESCDDQTCIQDAQDQVSEFESWSRTIKNEAYKKELQRMKIPLYSHLYLNIHSIFGHKHVKDFFQPYEYLFESAKKTLFLQDLQKSYDMDDISNLTCITKFRQNKYIIETNSEFHACLMRFLDSRHLLKHVVENWFDIIFPIDDPIKVVKDYFETNTEKSSVNETKKLDESETNNFSNIGKDENNEKCISTNKIKNLEKCRSSKGGLHNTQNDITNSNISKNTKNSNNTAVYNNDIKKGKKKTMLYQNSTTDNSSKKPNLKNATISKEKQISRSKKRRCESPQSSTPLSSEEKEVTNSKENSRFKRHISSQILKSANKLHNDLRTKKISSKITNKVKSMQRSSRISIIFGKNGNTSKLHKRLMPSRKHRMKKKKLSKAKQNKEQSEKSRKNPVKVKKESKQYSEDSTSDSISESTCDSPNNSVCDSSDYNSEDNPYVNFVNNKFSRCSRLRNKFPCYIEELHKTKIEVKNIDDDIHLTNLRQILLKDVDKCTCAIISDDQSYVIAGTENSKIYLWKRYNNLKKHKSSIFDMYEANSKNSYSSSTNRRVNKKCLKETYDVKKAKVLCGHGGSIFGLVQLPDTNEFISVSKDQTMKLWDMKTGDCITTINQDHVSSCVTVSSYSSQIATGATDSNGYLWSLAFDDPLRIYFGHRDHVLSIKFHPNEIYLATGSTDLTVRLYHIISARCVRVFQGHRDHVICLQFHALDPYILASADLEGGVIIWDLLSGLKKWSIWFGTVGTTVINEMQWLTTKVLLVALDCGLILKCDTNRCYKDKIKNVPAFKTSFDKQMNLMLVNDQYISIGVSGLKYQRSFTKIKETLQKTDDPSMSDLQFPDTLTSPNLILPSLHLKPTQPPNVHQLITQPMGFTTTIPKQQHQAPPLNLMRPPSNVKSKFSGLQQPSKTNVQNTGVLQNSQVQKKPPQIVNQANPQFINIQQVCQPQYRLAVPQTRQVNVSSQPSQTILVSQHSLSPNGSNKNVEQVNVVPIQTPTNKVQLVSTRVQPTNMNFQQHPTNIHALQSCSIGSVNNPQQSYYKTVPISSTTQIYNTQKPQTHGIHHPRLQQTGHYLKSVPRHAAILLPNNQLVYTTNPEDTRFHAVTTNFQRNHPNIFFQDQIPHSSDANRAQYISVVTSTRTSATNTVSPSISSSTPDTTGVQTPQLWPQ
ncbi:uncharacterized protein LOC126836592 isoform X2 [Adelges cooleyi]|uniref:uncharacterized protein LOC126836592 isoform X2 n=1 Tax=Adelges cooleyi TaxID=133065 RepID=UPI00217F5C9B|nr:uncharacterized protein LOC126836592 isoform X2 [Adelges cooleyi]